MNVVGYCDIKYNATTGFSAVPLELFIGKLCRIIEFGRDESVMVIDSGATGLATFDKKDIYRSFECIVDGDIIYPPNTTPVERILYLGKLLSRKGGYNNTLKAMVIQCSLMKGKFTDNFLWQLQDEEPFPDFTVPFTKPQE